MRFATIDIGTNSMRLLLSEYENNEFKKREKLINTTRMGQGIDSSGFIVEEAMDRNLVALKNFKEEAEKFGADKISCIGTAALRNASNKMEFVERARKLGMEIEIIPGEEEARLGYIGVVGGVEIEELALILDIGGGSTEFILGDNKEIYYRKSVDIGALRLTERFVEKTPETDEIVSKIEDCIKTAIGDTIEEIKKKIKDNSKKIKLDLVGIGGTITSVSAINQNLKVYSMEKVHNSKVSISQLNTQIEEIRKKELKQRMKIDGLQPKRAEIILSGELILKAIMEELEIDEIKISEYDNLEGMVISYK